MNHPVRSEPPPTSIASDVTKEEQVHVDLLLPSR
jgi:hypothetical protein